MKIAYLFDTFPSPSETFLAREIAALRNRGLEIEIWALNAGEGAFEVETANRIWKLRGDEFWRATGEKWARQLQIRGIDHLHAAWANHPALIAMHAAPALNLDWSFAAHARDLWVEGGDLKLKLASAKFAVACTRAGANELQKHASNAFYAPHGIELRKYPFRVWQPNSHPKLLGVGRLVEKKGWLSALEAAQKSGIPLELIGEGPLRSQLSGANLRGALSHEEVIAAMQSADCFVLPSQIARDGDRDGLANVLLEAAALGIPLVTTRAGSATDLVNDDTGWLCEIENLAPTIRQVFAEPDETRRRCTNARKRVEERFDVERNVAVLARAFKEKLATDEHRKHG